jgi:RNA ligase (TIGR02306 family)
MATSETVFDLTAIRQARILAICRYNDLLISPDAMKTILNWEELVVDKSTHKVEVVPVVMEKHPNADNLSIIPVFGYTYVGRTEEWKGVNRAAYIPPDSLVDTRLPEFMFLAGDARYDENSFKGGPYARVRIRRFRTVVSYGLMVPVSDTVELGSDVAELFGVLHYEPPIQGTSKGAKTSFYTGGEVESGPALFSPKYDVDSFQRYARMMFTPGELVHASEKIHGANGRWVYHDGRYYCGSRTEWKREYAQIPVPDRNELIGKLTDRILKKDFEGVYVCGFQVGQAEQEAEKEAEKIIQTITKKNEHPQQNMWWKALRATPTLEAWLKEHPDIIVYGEVYGAVQNLKYGVPNGEVRIAVFDLLDNGRWIDVHAARLAAPDLPWVPVVADNMPYDFDKLIAMSDGPSLVPGANHYREGIVVKPLQERNDLRLGRVQLKIVSPTYLEKS